MERLGNQRSTGHYACVPDELSVFATLVLCRISNPKLLHEPGIFIYYCFSINKLTHS